jgi:hypothetical protein
MNEYGNLDDPRYLDFEKKVGSDVEAFLKSLLDNGVSIAEVRLASHYLMMYLTGVEAGVVLKQQIKERRQRKRGGKK